MNLENVLIDFLKSRKISSDKLKSRTDQTLEWCEKNQIKIITLPFLPSYLSAIHDPPRILFVKGNAEVLKSPSFAVVGARRASSYGLACAFHFSREIASQGWVIVSGLAKGVDGYGHRGALSVRGQTIAIFGAGFKNIYPAENRQLAYQIIDHGGAWVSEYLPEELPLPHHFPERNRIIAGLARGILVIEARSKSGSLITALSALNEGREVFVIPGPIHSKEFEGSHGLIQQGAKLVFKIRDVLEEFEGIKKTTCLSRKHSLPFSFGEVIHLSQWSSFYKTGAFSQLQLAIQEGHLVQIAPHRFLCVE